MKKTFLAVIFCVLFFAVPSYAKGRFVTFPGIGECTGTYVRYREDPDTESEIVGRLNKPDRVIVLSQTAVDGETWYEIEDPKGEGIAFVFGKYIEPLFIEEIQRKKSYSLMINILQDYGINKDKANFYNGPRVRTRYDDNGNLSYIEVSRKGCSFGEISIGDEKEKIEEILDSPEDFSNDVLEYEIDLETFLSFYVEDGQITRMVFEY